MNSTTKVRGIIRLLQSKKYRWVVLIPFFMLVAFTAYSIITESIGQKPEEIVMDDGTVRLHKSIVAAPLKLPKEVSDFQDLAISEIKIQSYDINLADDRSVASIYIYAKVADSLENVVSLYRSKYGLDDNLEGEVKGYQMKIHSSEINNTLTIKLEKN